VKRWFVLGIVVLLVAGGIRLASAETPPPGDVVFQMPDGIYLVQWIDTYSDSLDVVKEEYVETVDGWLVLNLPSPLYTDVAVKVFRQGALPTMTVTATVVSTVTSTATISPTGTATATSTATPTIMPITRTPTATSTPTATPKPTRTPRPTRTPKPTRTPRQ